MKSVRGIFQTVKSAGSLPCGLERTVEEHGPFDAPEHRRISQMSWRKGVLNFDNETPQFWGHSRAGIVKQMHRATRNSPLG